ncbi:MAG: 4Fe-4S binding protein [Candidatus Hydrogenedentes bacterium]|nr:4Fe-4S binding protein [Candidatus Hydrogenedentota bacterium]
MHQRRITPGNLLRSPSSAVLRCVGCGACEFVCPSRRALVSHLHDLKRRYQDGSGALVR